MAASPSEPVRSALRTAVRPGPDRFLVGIRSDRDRARISAALASEGQVIEAPTARDALAILSAEGVELAIFDDESVILAAQNARPFADLVLMLSGDVFPGPPGPPFDVLSAVLPSPLPASDSLLRAHVRWLVSCRRSWVRGRLLRNASAEHRVALEQEEPALANALQEILARAITAMDVQVVQLGPQDDPAAALSAARARVPGAALVVADSAPTSVRAAAVLYGGARIYVDGRGLTTPAGLAGVVAAIGARRLGELQGRHLLETLARFGVLDDPARTAAEPPRDVDARLIADTTADQCQFVPSGHEVLVVDDELVVLTVLREALRRGGYGVTTAASAEEAMDLMARRTFDLVLTDKNLPGASGLEVLRFARTLTPAPAVVLITGYSSYDSAAQALDIGALDYIEKPIRDLDQLRARIRRALSRRDEQMSRATGERLAISVGSHRILLVEVDGPRRILLTDFLRQRYAVTAVSDGAEALAVMASDRFDMVLADRNLPGMTGLRVIEQAQKLLPHCATVLYTGYPTFENVKEAFALGVDALAVRPSEDLRALADKVEGALRGRGGILLG